MVTVVIIIPWLFAVFSFITPWVVFLFDNNGSNSRTIAFQLRHETPAATWKLLGVVEVLWWRKCREHAGTRHLPQVFCRRSPIDSFRPFVDFGWVRVCRCTGWKDHVHIRDGVCSPWSLSGTLYSSYSVQEQCSGMQTLESWHVYSSECKCRAKCQLGCPYLEWPAVNRVVLLWMIVVEIAVCRVEVILAILNPI